MKINNKFLIKTFLLGSGYCKNLFKIHMMKVQKKIKINNKKINKFSLVLIRH